MLVSVLKAYRLRKWEGDMEGSALPAKEAGRHSKNKEMGVLVHIQTKQVSLWGEVSALHR